jgi:hypothetical protein
VAAASRCELPAHELTPAIFVQFVPFVAEGNTMPTLTFDQIQAYRAHTYRLAPGARLTDREQAIAYVAERGFVYFRPIKGVTLPSLWGAVAGDRPVPDEHDDPGHVTWGWKDELLGARVWYYAKLLRKKATFVSLDVVPAFYALSENFGEPEQDYLVQYDAGRLTVEAKTLYETLLTEGPLDTVSLRKLARMTSKASDSPFNRALETLQADFKILPVGVSQAGAWKYAFIYECVHRWYPDLPERAHAIRQAEARATLAGLYLRSVGAAQLRDLAALFGWPAQEVAKTVEALVRAGIAQDGITVADRPGAWVALGELVG